MTAGDVRLMLKDGNLPPNSLWIDPKKGTKWRVDGNTKWWLLVETLKDVSELPERGEKQRLVQVYSR